MKYKITIQDNDDDYNKIILPKNIQLIEYLFDDMESFGEPIFQSIIEKVINKNSDYEEIAGNICNLQIGNEFTIISAELVETNMQNECKIETNELLELIKVWAKVNKGKFKHN